MKRVELFGFLLLLSPLSIGMAQTKTDPQQQSSVQLAEGQSVVFGFLQPSTHAYGRDRSGYYTEQREMHRGLIGSLIKYKTAVVVSFRDVALNTTVSAELKQDLQSQAMFFVVLSRGTYSVSTKHVYTIDADRPVTVPGNRGAMYVGDLSLWHSDIAGSSWIQCTYAKESVDRFTQQYPQFAGKVTRADTLCGELPPANSKLLGDWQGAEENDRLETIMFMPDGSVNHLVSGARLTGSFRFLSPDKIKILYSRSLAAFKDKLNFSEEPAFLGPLVLTVEVGDQTLVMKMSDSTTFRYRRSAKKVE